MAEFHGDKYLSKAVCTVIEQLPVTSFVETGTCRGNTTEFIASKYDLPIFTCDIDSKYYEISKKRLEKYSNVEIRSMSSEKYIKELIERKVLGDFPFFFLDAHPTCQPWLKYVPLSDEVKLISSLKRAVILIDDFKIPSQPQFGYNSYDSGEIGINMIKNALDENNNYQFLIPTYKFPEMPTNIYRGHIFIFQNCPASFQRIIEIDFIRQNYKAVSIDELE